jgi:hypothetical protein
MTAKPLWIVFITLCAALLAWCVYRDIMLESQYTNDLRNRIVGARLEKDHISPYFYQWSMKDGVRYYNPGFDTMAIDAHNGITASPFFHHLMAPIADFSGRTISRIWLGIEYLALLAMLVIALAIAATPQQKLAVVVTAAAFLLTEAWKMHISVGQNYLLIPLLALSFYFFFRKSNSLWYAATAGLCAITLVLIRPNSLVFFLPFLLVLKRYPLRYIVVLCLPVVLIAGWSLADNRERGLWIDYKRAIAVEVKLHQSGIPFDTAAQRYYYTDWDGWRKHDIEVSAAKFPYVPHNEHGNAFILYEKIFHRKTNLTILYLASATTILFLFTVFAWRNRSATVADLPRITVFGFCLYMVSDLFSPVWRHQHYTIQWLCPLLLVAATFRPSQKLLLAILGFGLLLNIVNLDFMKMEHTIGEYLLLMVLLLAALRPHTFSNNTDRLGR